MAMKYDFEDLMKENMKRKDKPSDELNRRVLDKHNSREVYNMRRKQKTKRGGWQHFPKVAAIAAALLLATGGVTYAATSLWNWNRDVAEEFGVKGDKEAMESLSKEGFAQQPADATAGNDIVSVTDKDIEVKVLQTLADEHSAYIYFEVHYGEKYHVVKKGATATSDTGVTAPMVHFTTHQGDALDYCGGISKIKDDHTITYEYFLQTSGMKECLTGKKINMSIQKFTMDQEKADPRPKVIARGGNWDLSWDLASGTTKRVYHLNRDLKLGKYRIALKDLEITPLSCHLTFRCPDGVCLYEIMAVVEDRGDVPQKTDKKGNIEIIRYVKTGGMEGEDEVMAGLPDGQTLYCLDTAALFVNGKEFHGDGGMGLSGKNDIYNQFDKVLDLNRVNGCQIAGKYIDLEDCTYETL